MKNIRVFPGLAAALMVGLMGLGASSASAKDLTAQQSKMTVCNKQAADKKGDDRKAFMKSCLSAKSEAPVTQQEKMTACNKQAVGKKGDDRKSFMKSCLSSKPAA